VIGFHRFSWEFSFLVLLICFFLGEHALLPFCEGLIVEAFKARRQMRIRLSNGSAPSPSETLVRVVTKLLAMHIRGGPVRVLRLERTSKMLTDQHSTFFSRQSCSQSVDAAEEGGFGTLHFADHQQLWLTYKTMQPTAPWQKNLNVFATAPCRGLSLSR
jgi:hypothetical protein